MKKLIAVAFCLLFVGCGYNKPVSSKVIGEWDVELCFEHDGYKVYRFEDGGHSHYYVTPVGSTSRVIVQQQGKNAYYRPEEIITSKGN